MRPAPAFSSPNAQGRPSSLHSTTYNVAGMGVGELPPAQALPPPSELTSMYTRQFAMSKSAAPNIYQAAVTAAAATSHQSYTHGLTVLQCARSKAPVDPHVYRDWLIFEERLKQSYRRLQRKRRNYFVQVVAFGLLVVYFAWFGFFGTKSYRLLCKLLSVGSAYCIYLIVTNRRFLQSIKYPTQCNRALHQLRMRFETSPIDAPNTFMVAAAVGATDSASNVFRVSHAGVESAAATSSPSRNAGPASLAGPSSNGLMTESQLSFFPTVPRQLRDGYMEFKATYYRKRDAAKKRLQERMHRDKQRKPSSGTTGPKPNDRRLKQRTLYEQYAPYHDAGLNESPMPSYASTSNAGSTILGLGSFLSGADSATDDSSTTASSVLSRRPMSTNATRRAGSNLAYSMSERASSSEGESSKTPVSLRR